MNIRTSNVHASWMQNFLSSNCYITDHLRLEQFVFALVDPSAHYEEILTDIRRTFLVSANMFLHEIDKKTRFTFADPFKSIIFSFWNRPMTNEKLEQSLHFNVITFYFHISHIIYVKLLLSIFQTPCSKCSTVWWIY